VTNKTAANRYARALLDVAIAEKTDVRAVERQLADIVQLFADSLPLREALHNPAIPIQKKRAVMDQLLQRIKPMPTLGKLLTLLTDRDRLVLLPDLLAAYRDRLLDYLKIVRAEVTTAVPLSPERSNAVEQSLAAMTGRTVTLETRVDPSIIGGVVARIGSTVYDGSVTRQLEKMKEKLVAGSA
jgi:F-type H+-transporting ATPase subunit delta